MKKQEPTTLGEHVIATGLFMYNIAEPLRLPASVIDPIMSALKAENIPLKVSDSVVIEHLEKVLGAYVWAHAEFSKRHSEKDSKQRIKTALDASYALQEALTKLTHRDRRLFRPSKGPGYTELSKQAADTSKRLKDLHESIHPKRGRPRTAEFKALFFALLSHVYELARGERFKQTKRSNSIKPFVITARDTLRKFFSEHSQGELCDSIAFSDTQIADAIKHYVHTYGKIEQQAWRHEQ